MAVVFWFIEKKVINKQVFGAVAGDSKQLSNSSVKNKSFGFNLSQQVFGVVAGDI